MEILGEYLGLDTDTAIFSFGLLLAFCEHDLIYPITSKHSMIQAAPMQASLLRFAQHLPRLSPNAEERGVQHQPPLRLG